MEPNPEPIVNRNPPIAAHRHRFSSIATRWVGWLPVLAVLAGLAAGSALGQTTGKQEQELVELMRRRASRKTSTATPRAVAHLAEFPPPLASVGPLALSVLLEFEQRIARRPFVCQHPASEPRDRLDVVISCGRTAQVGCLVVLHPPLH